MILKVYYGDNDFEATFEMFFKHFRFENYYKLTDDIKDTKQFRDTRIKMEDLYEKIFFKPDKVTTYQKRKFVEYVRQSILSYLKASTDTNTYNYLEKMLDVKLVPSLKENWYNGEVIYYLITADKYIIM